MVDGTAYPNGSEMQAAEWMRSYAYVSFAPPGLGLCSPFHPRLAAWAAFFRRFAAALRTGFRGRSALVRIFVVRVLASGAEAPPFCVLDAALKGPFCHGCWPPSRPMIELISCFSQEAPGFAVVFVLVAVFFQGRYRV